jgi:hypothetical protein
MPEYKQRKIELTLKRYEDVCPVRTFASRRSASAVALKEAKCIVDSLDVPV